MESSPDTDDWKKRFKKEYTPRIARSAFYWIGLTVGIAALGEWIMELLNVKGNMYNKVSLLAVTLISAINVDYWMYWKAHKDDRNKKNEDNRSKKKSSDRLSADNYTLIGLIVAFVFACTASALFRQFNPDMSENGQNIVLWIYILGIFIAVFIITFFARFRINIHEGWQKFKREEWRKYNEERK